MSRREFSVEDSQPKSKKGLHHEGTKVAKEEISRKGAKGAKEKRINLCELGV
jgi:hypothetical protein